MMPQHTTFAYLTNRRAPMVEWFLDSLHRELEGDYANVRIVIVDFYADEPGRRDAFAKAAHSEIVHVTPKPTVWQGPHRLTKVNYFAAANTRNTAICLAPDGWIVFADDLSVLLPGWIKGVLSPMVSYNGGYVILGAYKKVKELVVENGEVKSFAPFPQGVDVRWHRGRDEPVEMGGGDLYGCSFGAPTEALLTVNGLDENCDSTGLGSEDQMLGIRLINAGFRLKYDRRMLTYESEERHAYSSELAWVDTVNGRERQQHEFLRCDKGLSPNDKSHAILHQTNGTRWAPNYFGDGGIRALRARVLAGEPFPVMGIPEHDWYDGVSIREL